MHPNLIQGFRLSPQQRRLWSLLLRADAAPFRAQCVIDIEGDLAPDLLRQAVAEAARRHEILRTLFRRLPGVTLPVQLVAETCDHAWQTIDLTELTPERQQAAVEELQRGDGSAFDFESGPVMRLTLLTLAARHSALLVSLPATHADPRTLTNLFGEVARCYAALAEGRTLTDEPWNYVRFSDWQNELLEDEDAGAGADYWRRQPLADIPSFTLPFAAGAGDGAPRFEPRHLTLTIEPRVASRLADAAAHSRTTPERILLACWHTLLWRLTRRPELTVGQLFDGREYEMLEGVCGLLARWLPVRCRFDDGLRLSDVLSQLDESAREAQEWQDYFNWEAEGQTGGDARQQFFPFGFESQELPGGLTSAGLTFSLRRQHSYTEPFHVKLSCLRAPDGLTLELHYDSAVLEAEGAGRLARQFETLLASALEDAERPVGELELLGEAERRLLLFEWNDTAAEYPRDRCLHELFEAQAAATPDAPAVVSREEKLTYAELNRRANQLAHRLRGLGVGPETRVALLFERAAEMIVALCGVLKAGGAYVPLDPAYPAERLAFMLEDAGASVLLTRERLRAYLPGETRARVFCLDTEADSLARASAENPTNLTAPENLAYVIYTSGSTGRPKGVMIRHASAVNLWAALRSAVYAGAGEGLRVSVNAPLAFDASVKQVLQLLSGHALHVVPEDVRLNATELLAFIAEQRLDVFDCTPSQLKMLEAAVLMGRQEHAPALMLVGGEALDEAAWALLRVEAKTRVYNVYGPTECTVDTTACAIWKRPERPSIGRPLSNVRVYLLDRRLRPVPLGAVGEIHVGGAGVARGYLGRAGLTAASFVPDSFSGEPGARLYRTGDLARYRADGELEYVGRVDHQVKVRGFRIELGEIESALLRHEGVRDCVVVAREDGAASLKRLVAYVVPRRESQPKPAELREHLSASLPEYMIPTAFVPLEALPLTRNGKVDRDALPAPEAVARELPATYVAPRNEVEQTIVNIWQEVLQVDKVGVSDNFFDLGGHSLLVVQVHGRLREAFGKDLSIVELFRNHTVSALAGYFDDGRGQLPAFEQAHSRAERRKQAAGRRTQSRAERKREQ